jgi:hypothetical protein
VVRLSWTVSEARQCHSRATASRLFGGGSAGDGDNIVTAAFVGGGACHGRGEEGIMVAQCSLVVPCHDVEVRIEEERRDEVQGHGVEMLWW